MDILNNYQNLSAPRIVGLMSGTSIDAIDAVLVELHNNRPQFVRMSSLPLPEKVRSRLLDICRNQANTEEITRMHWLMG